MKKILFVFIIFLLNVSVQSQTFEEFKTEYFKLANNLILNEKNLEEFNQKFMAFTFPMSGIEGTFGAETDSITTLLLNLKINDEYNKSLRNLMNSSNLYSRILAYQSVLFTQDNRYEDTLRLKYYKEIDKSAKVMIGSTLLFTKSNYTSTIFDFLVQNEEIGDAHYFQFYVRLNQDSIMNTAYARINDTNKVAQILAAQSLSVTKLNPKTDSLLRKALKEWDLEMKGYLLYPIKELGMGNLLELIKPLLEHPRANVLANEVLSSSPTAEDRNYLNNKALLSDTLSEDYLNGLMMSYNIDNVLLWLKLLQSDKVPADYFFSVWRAPLFNTSKIIEVDSLTKEVIATIKKITNKKYCQYLIRTFDDIQNEEISEFLISLLYNANNDVRETVGLVLKNKPSDKLNAALKTLLIDKNQRLPIFIKLAIEGKMKNVASIIESIYKNTKENNWQSACLEYYSAFPLPKYKSIFVKVLNDSTSNFSNLRCAALGLGKLNDAKSISLIERVMYREANGSDWNVKDYLLALSYIKDEKVKPIILKYENSKEPTVRELVKEIKKGW